MSWYMWIMVGILAINGFVIVAVALFVLYDWLRDRRERLREKQGSTHGGRSD